MPHARLPEQLSENAYEISVRRVDSLRGRQQEDVISFRRQVVRTSNLSENALVPVANNRIPEFFPRYKRNATTRAALVINPLYDDAKLSTRCAFAQIEDFRYLNPRLNRIHSAERHAQRLVPRMTLIGDGELLATLGATASEHLTSVFGGHTSTEAVALSTLTSVRLIGALHIVSLSWFRATC